MDFLVTGRLDSSYTGGNLYFAGLLCYPGAFGSVLDGGSYIRLNG